MLEFSKNFLRNFIVVVVLVVIVVVVVVIIVVVISSLASPGWTDSHALILSWHQCARYWLGLLCLLGCLAGWQGRLRFHRVKGEQIITNGKQLASWDKSLILMVYIHCISFTFFTDTKCVWLFTAIQRNTLTIKKYDASQCHILNLSLDLSIHNWCYKPLGALSLLTQF